MVDGTDSFDWERSHTSLYGPMLDRHDAVSGSSGHFLIATVWLGIEENSTENAKVISGVRI